MRSFDCECGSRIFFENWRCVRCTRELGFIATRGVMSALEARDDTTYTALADGSSQRKCANYAEQGVCNWLVPAEEAAPFCQACRLNRIVPDLSDPQNRQRWAEVESAKRRLLYSLNGLRLPVTPRTDSADGLAFDIKAEAPGERVITGHADGLITLNLSEADPVSRERARIELRERYRTLLGHFRHEVGHHYWELLVRDTHWHASFREVFGDERADYGEALRLHYEQGVGRWQDRFISSYASSHPWEDWAESWAHYLHITDTLETARHFGFVASAPSSCGQAAEPIADMLATWGELSIALNALNRSMGMPDPYPFQLSPPVIEKLELVHRVIREAGRDDRGQQN